MLNRVLTLILFLLTASLIFIALLIFKNEEPSFAPSSAINAVPNDASLIFEINESSFFRKTNNPQTPVFEAITNFSEFSDIFKEVLLFDSLITENKAIEQVVENSPFLVSMHQSGKDAYGLIFYLTAKTEVDFDAKETDLKQFFGKNAKVEIKRYNENKIYKISQTDRAFAKAGFSDFSFTLCRGIVIISRSAILVESAVRHLFTESSILKNTGFKLISKNTGKKAPVTMFLNIKNFPKLFGQLFQPPYRNTVESFESIAQWASLDLNFTQEMLLLNGFCFAQDSLANFLNVFKNQGAVVNRITAVIPEKTVAFASFGVENFDKFREDYKKYLNWSGEIHKYNHNINTINEIYKINVEEIFYPMLENEIASVYFDMNQDKFAIFEVKDSDDTYRQLDLITAAYAKVEKLKKTDFTKIIEINGKEMIFAKMPIKNLAVKLFGEIFDGFSTDYYTVFNNFLIMGSSSDALVSFVEECEYGNVLANDKIYREFANNIIDETNFYFYFDFGRSVNKVTNLLSQGSKRFFTQNAAKLNKFSTLAIQTVRQGNLFYNQISLKYLPTVEREPHTLWETRLDTIINFKPKIVKNHVTEDKEVIMQDEGGKLYLISNTGKILWNFDLNEKIISDIYQIDLFKNNKLQLLFNTRTKLYIIDRLGRVVENFPKKFKSAASAGLSLFDYDADKDYRIFVPCTNHTSVLYNVKGEEIKGWNFEKTTAEVTNEAQHLIVEKKDYIVFSDSSAIYFLNRKGEVRQRVKKTFAQAKNYSLIYEPKTSQNAARLVTTDINGKIYFIYFNGKVETTEIRKFSAEHFFVLEDVDKDGYKDFIFADDTKLEVYNQQKKKLFEKQFEAKILQPPLTFVFQGGKRKIGVCLAEAEKIYILNADGSNFSGFPLQGHSLFSIANLKKGDNKMSLLVANKKKFLFNYKFQ